MRILCVLQTLRTGGAQRVFSLMADAWIAEGHEVSLLLFTDESELDFTPVHPSVEVHHMGILGESGGGLPKKALKNLGRFPVVRKAVAKIQPDCAVGFMIDENLVLRLSTLGMSTPVILIEHSPFSYDPGYLKRMLRDIVYAVADGVVMLTRQAKDHAVGSVRSKTVVIENPIRLPEHFALRGRENPEETRAQTGGVFLAIGRFARQKRFDRLVRAFSLIADRSQGWELHLYGSGDQENGIKALVTDLHLEDRVFLKGAVKEPWTALSVGDVFVMSSDTEGFPMSLIEAMACGLAVVSTDCPTGPGELIIPEVNGLLVPTDESLLARGMLKLAMDKPLREKLGSEATKIKERLDCDRIMDRYNRFLNKCITTRKSAIRV